jgi:hypothetical protein
LLAFGSPVQGKAGFKFWNFADFNKMKSEEVEGIPTDVECNAARWISDRRAIASFCQGESSRSHIYLVETNGQKWTGSYLYTTSDPMRITTIAIRKDKLHVYFGCDNGSVSIFDLQNPAQAVLIERQHSSSGLKYVGPVPWTGRSTTGDDLSQLGVSRMVYDEHTGLLGITYLDSTAAFLDPVLGTYVKYLTLRGHPRRPGIALVGPSTFITPGEGGLLFEVQRR